MSRPKCPNHTVEMDKTDTPRIWICPVSGARFEAESEEQDAKKKVKIDLFGRIMQKWNIKPIDEE